MSELLRSSEKGCPQWHSHKKWPETGKAVEFIEWDSWAHTRGMVMSQNEDRRRPPKGLVVSDGLYFRLWDAVRMWRYVE